MTIVVTGTDTDIGKTVFTAGLVRLIDGAYWKPVQSGLAGETDSEVVARLAALPPERVLPERYRLVTPCSPHQAAEIDGVTIDPDLLDPPATARPLVIEGAGGALVPLTRTLVYADLMARWGLPTVIVARTSLGTINHSLLTIEALRARRVPLIGIALVGDANEESESIIAELGRVKRLGRLPRLEPLTPEQLHTAFAAVFDRNDFI